MSNIVKGIIIIVLLFSAIALILPEKHGYRYTIRYNDWQGVTVYDKTNELTIEKGCVSYTNEFKQPKKLCDSEIHYTIVDNK